MQPEEKTKYLANIVKVIQSDNMIVKKEEAVFNGIARDIGLGVFYMDKAEQLANAPDFTWYIPERYSDKMRLIEDALFVCNIDEDFDENEKKCIRELMKAVHLDQSTYKILKKQCIQRLKALR